jgi:hypothetical protein
VTTELSEPQKLALARGLRALVKRAEGS